jgi:hypothetical protein
MRDADGEASGATTTTTIIGVSWRLEKGTSQATLRTLETRSFVPTRVGF